MCACSEKLGRFKAQARRISTADIKSSLTYIVCVKLVELPLIIKNILLLKRRNAILSRGGCGPLCVGIYKIENFIYNLS